MTDTELQMLTVGFLLGTYLMLAAQLAEQWAQARRTTRIAEATLARTTKQLATQGWRDILTCRERP